MKEVAMKRISYKKECKIPYLLLLLTFFIHGCAFGAPNKEAGNMLQETTRKIIETGSTMSINEVKEVRIENTPGIEIAVFCQAYTRTETLENSLQPLQIPAATIDAIQNDINFQDGIYLFLLKNGRIVAKGSLGGEVGLSEPVLAATLQDSLSLEIMRLGQEWRYLQIRKIK